jgi:hypothetical protein
VDELGKEIPDVRSSLLNAMGNVRPSHLFDPSLNPLLRPSLAQSLKPSGLDLTEGAP